MIHMGLHPIKDEQIGAPTLWKQGMRRDWKAEHQDLVFLLEGKTEPIQHEVGNEWASFIPELCHTLRIRHGDKKDTPSADAKKYADAITPDPEREQRGANLWLPWVGTTDSALDNVPRGPQPSRLTRHESRRARFVFHSENTPERLAGHPQFQRWCMNSEENDDAAQSGASSSSVEPAQNPPRALGDQHPVNYSRFSTPTSMLSAF